MTYQILDIYYDNPFDAVKEKATGTDGVIIKMGQGQYMDYFVKKCHYIDDCERVGLPWGTYYLPDARYSPESSKAAFKSVLHAKADFGPLLMGFTPSLAITRLEEIKMAYNLKYLFGFDICEVI